MVLLKTPEAELGAAAIDFQLPGVDGNNYSLSDVSGAKGTLVMFICNHCPYVKAVISRLVEQSASLAQNGIGVAAICSNDAVEHPEDSFDNMKKFAEQHKFGFPYLCDETQEVARAYGAVCTPDFFGYDGSGRLAYRGRLDDCVMDTPTANTKAELLDGMLEIAAGGQVSAPQLPSMGCSIKWK